MANTLPPEVLNLIFHQVGNPSDLLNCERTCKAFRNVLQDDSAWSTCRPRGTSRDSVWHHYGIKQIKKYQSNKQVSNFLLDTLGPFGWLGLVSNVAELLLSTERPEVWRVAIRLRGDTSAVLIALVQNFMTIQFERANLIMTETLSEMLALCPTLTARHWNLQVALLQNAAAEYKNGGSVWRIPSEEDEADPFAIANRMLDLQSRTKIIRLLAYRAGVVKMEDALFDLAWNALVHLIFQLLRPVYIELSAVEKFNQQKQLRQGVYQGAGMRYEPPFSHKSGEFPAVVTHTPVPGQIEEAARRLGIPHKYYGNEWHCFGGTEEELRTQAEAEYMFEGDMDWTVEDGTEGDAEDDDEHEGSRE